MIRVNCSSQIINILIKIFNIPVTLCFQPFFVIYFHLMAVHDDENDSTGLAI